LGNVPFSYTPTVDTRSKIRLRQRMQIIRRTQAYILGKNKFWERTLPAYLSPAQVFIRSFADYALSMYYTYMSVFIELFLKKCYDFPFFLFTFVENLFF